MVQRFRGQQGVFAEIQVERARCSFGGDEFRVYHNGEDGERGAQVPGPKVGFEESFVVVDLEVAGSLAEDAEDVGREAEIAVSSGGVEHVDTHPVRGVQVAGLDSLTPGVEGDWVIVHAASSVENVVPECGGAVFLGI